MVTSTSLKTRLRRLTEKLVATRMMWARIYHSVGIGCKFDEDPDQSDVMYVAMLLPLVQ